MSTKWFILFTAVLIGATLHISAAGHGSRVSGTSQTIAATDVTRKCGHCGKTDTYTVWNTNDSVVCTGCGATIAP